VKEWAFLESLKSMVKKVEMYELRTTSIADRSSY
jgi:hypothetical protein